jgi:Heparinase II/III-like protein/Heparinase II/III N-terminus
VRLRTLRREPWPTLIAEAGWRIFRFARIAVCRLGVSGADCPVLFRPLGYDGVRPLLGSEEHVVAYADAVLRGEYPLLGYGSPVLGLRPDWQCDWVSGKYWSMENSRKMQIVRHDGSDVKAPWELSRLQFAPVIAKAYGLTGERKYRDALRSLLTDWIVRNPVGQGVHWTIAMEAALRAISLCLTMDLLWPFTVEEKPWVDLVTKSLWVHFRFIQTHNEFSFLVRSNHYLSNLVGLTTLSAYLDGRGMGRRLRKYSGAVQREILLQTYADGGDREASTGYHVLVTQMAQHTLLVQRQSGCSIAANFEDRVRLMLDWVACLADQDGKLPLLGDCDNGRVELLSEDIEQAMLPAGKRCSLRVGSLRRAAACASRPVSVLPNSGVAVVRSGEASVIFCAMPNGLAGKGSHTHCDKLSIVFRLGRDEVFCDSGSRCYTRSAEWRNIDRSTAAHNTLMVDEADQNTIPSGAGSLFQCGNEALVSAIEIVEGESAVRASHWGYARIGIEHQRTVRLTEHALMVVDELAGVEKHLLELRYLLGPEWRVSSEESAGDKVGCLISGPRRLSLACEAGSPLSLTILPVQISREYGSAVPGCCIRIQTTAWLPARVQTRVQWE